MRKYNITDEELEEYFAKYGITKAQAEENLKKRGYTGQRLYDELRVGLLCEHALNLMKEFCRRHPNVQKLDN